MAGYTKLFSDIITSSIWNEDDKTRIVWITLLALSDATGYVHCAMPSLALMARVDQEACLAAIGRLEGPDEHSRTPENDGRRISKVDGGWVILNYEKHRNRLSDDPDTIYHREYMRKIREKHQKKLTKLTCINPASASASDKDRGEYERGKRPGFQKPTPTEVTEYAKSKGIDLDGKVFCSFYESKGWLVGKTPMKSWKAAVTGTWRNGTNTSKTHVPSTLHPNTTLKLLEELRSQRKLNWNRHEENGVIPSHKTVAQKLHNELCQKIHTLEEALRCAENT